MATDLTGLRVAILVTDGFEQAEMTEPRKALEDAGAATDLVSPQRGEVQAWSHVEKGDRFSVEVALDDANPANYDALLLPGGVANPDRLRIIPKAVKFVADFVAAHKPVAAICHAPWLLVEAGAVQGKTLTSWPSLRTDIQNAGGHWVDQEVVADQDLITSRKPDDIPAFNRKMIEVFQGSGHQARATRPR
jgi:protease I